MSGTNSGATHTLLAHLSINPERKPAVLLLHGAFSSKETWKPVHRHLERYHVLILTLPACPDIVTPLHLPVTFLWRDNVALHFATHHLPQILSLFVAGTAGFIRSKATPYALWLDGILSYAMPKSLVEYLIDADPSLRGTETFGGVRPMKLCDPISEILATGIEDE